MDGLEKLKADLKTGDISKLYLFYGEESYLRSFYLKRLESLCESPFPDFDLVKFSGDSLTCDGFKDAVESFPMGGGKKMIEVFDYPVFGNGPLKDDLPSILSDLPDHVCLVFVFDALEYKPDKRLGIYKTLAKYGETVEFQKAGIPELKTWIRRRFSALSKDISDADCEKLIFISGGLMTNLVTEIEKIASGTKEKTVTAADIEKMASRSLEAGVFDLTDRLTEGDVAKALSVLSDLLDMKNEPVAIAAMLTKHFKRLYGAKLGMDRKMSDDEITKLLGFRSSYPARIAMRSASRIPLEKLRWAQKLCLETDMALKSNNADVKRSLELLILRLAA